MSKLSKLFKKVAKPLKKIAAPLAGVIDPGLSFTGAWGKTAQYAAAKNISTGATGAMFLNAIPGAAAQMPGFSSGPTPELSGGSILDAYLSERRRRDELKAKRQVDQNVLADKAAAYNRDVTVAQIQAQSQFYSQLVAAGVPSAAFPGGWLPGSNTLNVPPGNYGSFPNTSSRVTAQDISSGIKFAPWMLYLGIAAIALIGLPFMVRGK